MTKLTELKGQAGERVRDQRARYAAGEDRPLRGYTVTIALLRRDGRHLGGLGQDHRVLHPGPPVAADVALSAAASHKLSRLLSKDPVSSSLRAHFTSCPGTSGPCGTGRRGSRAGGQKTVGELITCPFCTGVRIATRLVVGLIYLPRTTRLWLEKSAS